MTANRETKRVQLRRTKGWRKPEGAVVVSRPSRWGNPVRITPELGDRRGEVMFRVHGSPMDRNGGPAYALIETARLFATKFFEWDLLNGRYGDAYPSLDEIRRELAGRDLACWCPLPDRPGPDYCHAAVLLEIANALTPPAGGAAS
ncbi:DUF4326 domain-containing protein [Streptosporangium sp. V21-05]|uniref:DUF4326 domain-containing protein n=1 Tax=Streptosporangium sp. V21-05 TaxID=3446115 RepID=UPI003F53AC34